MVSRQNKSVTLIELIIAISLVAVIILGINSISIFSHYQVISSDRRAKLQNNVSYSLDHITKQGLKTIGNEKVFNPPVNSAVRVSALNATNSFLAFFIDANGNGRRDTVDDYWIRYSFASASRQLSYCDNCGSSSACGTCFATDGREVLSNKITAFRPTKVAKSGEGIHHVEVEITGRWYVSMPVSADNPEVTMKTTIQLPSVSTN